MYNITGLTKNEMDIILGGLGKIPAEIVYGLIGKIFTQMAVQPQEALPEQKTETAVEEIKPDVTASAVVGKPEPAVIQDNVVPINPETPPQV